MLNLWQTEWGYGFQEQFRPNPFGSPADGFRSTSRIADFDGDGRADLMVNTDRRYCNPSCPAWESTWKVLRSNSTSFVTGDWFSNSSIRPLVGDYNGDGNSDIAYVVSGSWRLRFGNGHRGGWNTMLALEVNSGISAGAGSPVVVADYDGDGFQDILIGGTSYLRSTGENLSGPFALASSISGLDKYPKVLDMNGDGEADYGFISTSGGAFSYRRHNGPEQDLVLTITDGLGNVADFQYKPITDNSVYPSPFNTGAVFPVTRHYEGSLHVASRLLASNGNGGTYTVTYTYENAAIHTQGRGFLGFQKRTGLDSRNGARLQETYLQDFPWIGAPSSAVHFESASGTRKLSEVTHTWSALSWGGGVSVRRHPCPSSTEAKTYDLGVLNSLVTTTTTNRTVDSFGTVTDATETTVESATGNAFSTRVYLADVLNDNGSNWCLSRPRDIQVTNTTPLGSLTRRTTVAYDALKCRATSETKEPGAGAAIELITSYGYDAWGNVNSTSVGGRTTQVGYGSTGQFPVQITNPVGHVEYLVWDQKLGVPTHHTDLNQLVTSRTYDAFGRMDLEMRPDTSRTDVILSWCTGGCGVSGGKFQIETQLQDGAGVASGKAYSVQDSFGRPIRSTSLSQGGGQSHVRTSYDALGRVSGVTAPYFTGLTEYWTTFSYDIHDRPTAETRPVDDSSAVITQSTTVAYDGLSATQTDAEGKATARLLDGWARVIRMTDAANGITQYAYDSFSNLKSVRDPANNLAQFTYDILGRKVSSADPDTGTWTYAYNKFGELTSQTDAKSQTTTLTYDALSRIKTRAEAEGTTTWTWDTGSGKGKGRIASISHPGSYSEAYSYDTVGRASQITTVADGINFALNFSYDAWGRPYTLQYPVSTPGTFRLKLRYVYEATSGVLQKVVDHAAPTTEFWRADTTNARGQVIQETLGNGLVTMRGFDEVTGWLDSVDTGVGAVQDLAYAWNKVGSLTQRQDLRQAKTEVFSYDALHRLTGSTLNGAGNLTMAYNSIGNITSKTGPGTYNYTTAQAGCSYYAHSQPHAVRKAGTTVYCYDANGNMTSRGGSSLLWTSYNLPSRINSGSNYADEPLRVFRRLFCVSQAACA